MNENKRRHAHKEDETEREREKGGIERREKRLINILLSYFVSSVCIQFAGSVLCLWVSGWVYVCGCVGVAVNNFAVSTQPAAAKRSNKAT